MVFRPVSFALAMLAACGGHARTRAPEPAPAGAGSAAPAERAFELVPQLGSAAGVRFVAFLGGSTHVVAASINSLQVWQVENGILLRSVDEESAGAIAVAGQRVVDSKLRLRDLATGAHEPLGEGRVRFVAATTDGKRVLATGYEDGVRVIDVATKRTLRTIAVPDANALAISDDGHTALAIEPHVGVHVLDVDGNRDLGTLASPIASRVALSPDGRRALVGTSDGGLQLFDVPSRRPITTFTGHTSEVNALALTADGQRAVSCALDGTLRIWDLAALQLVRTIKTDGHVDACTISADGRQILSAGMGSLRIWDTATGSLARTLRTIAPVSSVAVSADGKRELVGGADGIALWDLETGARVRSFRQLDAAAVALSPDGGRAVVAGKDAVRVVDTATGKVLATSPKLDSYHVAWLPDGRVLSGSSKGQLIVWAPDTGQQQVLREQGSAIYRIAAAADGKRVASVSDAVVTVWDLATGKALLQLRGHKRHAVSAAFSPDGKTIFTGGDAGVIAWDAATGGERWRHRHGLEAGWNVAVSPDGKRVVTTDKHIVILDAATGVEQKTLVDPDHDGANVASFVFLPDSVHAVSASLKGTSRVWNVDTNTSYAQLSSGTAWLIYTNEGYFDASRDGTDLVGVVHGLEGYRVDQLALRNNRPDLVLGAVGMGRPELLQHFRARHEHRLARAGLDGATLATRFDRAPRIARFDVTVDTASAKLVFDLAASTELRSYNVFVNDVPVFGAQGKSIAGLRVEVRETIELSDGRNKIEVAGIDRAGAESMRAVRFVVAERRAKHDLYVLGIGVSRYKNSDFDLAYPSKDVTDLVDVMRAMPGYAAVHVETYTDDRATVASLRAARQFLAKAGVDDTVVLFVAGHGMHDDDARATFYFLTHEADPDHLVTTAANFDLVEELLQGIAARKKLFLLDACESGEVDAERDAGLVATGTTKLGSRGLVRTKRARPRPTSAPPTSFIAFDRERFIYNDVLRRSGAVVLSSSTGSELSYEAQSLRNGVFTEAVMTALTSDKADHDHDGHISTGELQAFVASQVAAVTGDLQHPTIDRDNLEIDLRLPIATSAANVVRR